MKCFYTLVFSLFFLFSSLYSQTLVNLNWNENFGAPDTSISWSATKIDGGGNLLTVGNTIVAGEGTNLLLTCHDQDGTLMWQSDHHNANATDQFGIGVAEDASGNIYVCGSSTNSAIFSGSDSDYLIVKYNSQGVEQWARTYNGPDDGEDVAVAIAVSSGGDVFVTGMSEDTTSGYDFATIKYNSSGTQQWVQRYDRQNLEDVAVWIGTDIFGNAYVTGASGTAVNDWDIATLVYTSSGVKINEQVYTNVGTGYDRPTDMGFDNQGNIYITGTSSVDGIDYDIVTIKLNSSFQLQWAKTHDEAGLVDEARSLTVDNSGNVYVTGFVTKLSGKCLITIKYDTNGNVIWKETLGQGSQSVGDDISIHNNGDLIISGQQLNPSSSDAMALSFDSDGNIKWLTVQPTQNEASEPSTRLTMDSQGRAYISSITQETTSPSYAVQQYNVYSVSTELELDSLGEPNYLNRQLIVRFDESALNHDAINDLQIVFGTPETFLNSQEVNDFYAKVPSDPGVYTFLRIHKNLKTTDTVSISRLGEDVPIPAFWASFNIDLPSGVDILAIEDSLESLPFVHYAHPNYVGQFDVGANDSAFSMQHALFSTQFDTAHINIKPAWDFSRGDSSIRVGVFDTGIDWRHPDFGYDGIDPLSSVVVDGKDYETGAPLKTLADPEPDILGRPLDHHGTKAAGILGAVRNNNKGIAGIAGGDSTKKGISLYGMKIYKKSISTAPTEPPIALVGISEVSDAIVESSTTLDTSVNGRFGLHIMSNSWGGNPKDESGTLEPEEIDELREAVRYANRNHVIYLASRGNSGNQSSRFPSSYDDDWVISVGGSNVTGNGKHPESSFGKNVDLVAPFDSSMHWTLFRNNSYDSFRGTSAATPTVSGVAALILSYLNNNGFRCAPEDVEFILQQSARDIITPPADSGYDIFTGHGLLDAGEAMKLIDTTKRTIVHRGSNNANARITSEPYLQNTTIKFLELFDEEVGLFTVHAGTYTGDVYKITAVVPNDLPPGKSILYAWPRPSSSNVFPLLIQGPGDLLPHRKVEIESYTSDSTTLVGYVYQFQDSSGNLVTVPTPNTSATGQRLAYSLMLEDAPVSTEPLVEDVKINIYPNPTNDLQYIELTLLDRKKITLTLYDIHGKKIQEIYNSETNPGLLKLENQVGHLSSGLYVYQLVVDKRPFYLKFVKQ